MVKLHTVGKAAKYRMDEIIKSDMQKAPVHFQKAKFNSLRDTYERKSDGSMIVKRGLFSTVLFSKKRAEYLETNGATQEIRDRAKKDGLVFDTHYKKIMNMIKKGEIPPISIEERKRAEREMEVSIKSGNIEKKPPKGNPRHFKLGEYIITSRPPEEEVYPVKKPAFKPVNKR